MRFLSLGAQDLPTKNRFGEKIKTAMIPDEKSHGLGTQRKSSRKKKWSISDDFGLRSPVDQIFFQAKRAASIVAGVLGPILNPQKLIWRKIKTCYDPG